MIDLEHQIHGYYDAIVDPVDIAEVMAVPVGPSPVRTRRGLAVALTSAVLVLLVIGGGVFLIRGSDGPASEDLLPTPPTDPRWQPPALTWSRVSIMDPRYDSPDDIIVGGPGYVGVSRDGFSTSDDGKTWTHVQHEQVGSTWANASIATGGPGLVAVGVTPFETDVWNSVDGTSWSLQTRLDGMMYDLVSGGPGLIGVGVDERQPDLIGAAVWTSTDGIAWSKVRVEESTAGMGSAMWSVTAGGPGFVAVGYVQNELSAAVWTSPDGLSWSRIPHDETVFGDEATGDRVQVMRKVIVGGRGFVAIGEEEASHGSRTHTAVWTSPDGLAWDRVPYDEDLFGFGPRQGDGKVLMSDVLATEFGLIGVGWEEIYGSGGHGVVWSSPDGIQWSRTNHEDPPLDSAEPEFLIERDGVLILIGDGDYPDGPIEGFRHGGMVWTAASRD